MVSRGVVVVFPESETVLGEVLELFSRFSGEVQEKITFSSWIVVSSRHHAGFSHKDDRKYPGAGGSADIPSGDNARRR